MTPPPGGTRLRQTELADRLGISRTPIREALVWLREEGLIELRPRGGVRVAPLDPDEAVELYDLREVLDGLAARLAAGRRDGGGLRRLERALGRMGVCVERGDPTHWFPSHVEFHEEILRAAGNRHLARLAALVHLSIRQFHPMLLATRERLADADREHRQIFAAIAAQDPEGAERAARAHIAAAREIVLKFATAGRAAGGCGGAVQA